LAEVRYPAGGWLRPGTPISWQRNDQGKDLVIPWRGIIQAPAFGHCVTNGEDKNFPNGFGPRFAIVSIDDRKSEWFGHDYYIGHDTSLLSPGQAFAFGHPIARADQGHPSSIGIFPPNPPGDGGWIEFGEFLNGRCGTNDPSGHWFDGMLREDLIIKVPDKTLRFGDQGPRVLQFTGWLHDCGWLNRRWWHFNTQVHGAVVAFQVRHHIEHGNGEVGGHTSAVLRRTAHWCRVHHHKEK
jgi:hypothetical protein